MHDCVQNANDYFYIKEFNKEHTCGAAVRTSKNSCCTLSLIGRLIAEEVRAKPLKCPTDVITTSRKVMVSTLVTTKVGWV